MTETEGRRGKGREGTGTHTPLPPVIEPPKKIVLFNSKKAEGDIKTTVEGVKVGFKRTDKVLSLIHI